MADGYSVFEWSARRYILAAAVMGLVGAAVGWTLIALVVWAVGGRLSVVPGGGAVYFGFYVMFFPLFSFLLARGAPPRLAFGDEGIALTAERRDGAWVPRTAVSGARVRWFWPLTVLDVFVEPDDEPHVSRLGRARRRPLRRSTGGRVRFRMSIAGLAGSAADIRDRLQRTFPH